MLKRYWLAGAALVVCVCLCASLSSRAADKGKEAPDKEKPATAAADGDQPAEAKPNAENDPVADIVTAYKLADWARRMDPPSPFALCSAAEILHRTTLFTSTDDKVKGDVLSAPETTEKQDPKVLDAEATKLLDEALKVAKSDAPQDVAAVQAMAKAIKAGRGGLNGPLMFTMRLRPGQTDTYNIKFKKGEWARICVRHPEDNIVDLHATDRAGHDRAADWARNPVVSFLVRQGDGTDYKITVRNARGDETITYQMFTN